MEILDKKNYTLFLNSNDRISGTHNNATFQINWDDFLPRTYTSYKMNFNFQTVGGYYIDYLQSQTTTFSANIANTGVMTVTIAPTSGLLFAVGQGISAVGITAGTTITAFGTGTGGVGTYQLSSNGYILATQVNTVTPTVNGGKPITYDSAKVVMNSLGRSYSYDTSSKCPSYTLGVVQRDIQVGNTASLSCFYQQNPPKTLSRPNQNFITVSVYNNSYASPTLFTTTDNYGNTATYGGSTAGSSAINASVTDMTPWTMIIDLIPIEKSLTVEKH